MLYSLIFLFIPGVFIGFDFNNELLKAWLGSISSVNANSIMDDYGRQSLSSLVPAFFADTPIQFGFKRNLVSLSPDAIQVILQGFRALILLLLLFLFSKPFHKVVNKRIIFYELSLICAVTPLFFPHQGKYSFFYLEFHLCRFLPAVLLHKV